jgi:hypothetical protein
MKSIFIIILIFLILLFCLIGCIKIFSKKNKTQNNNELIYTKFIVDDSVIEQNDVFKIIEPLWWSVSIYDGEEIYKNDLQKFSNQQKYIFAIMWYQSEVNNGGHSQFYTNSTGIVWEDAMNGFKEIGLIDAYDIIKESVDRFDGHPDKDRNIRNNQMDKLDLEFDDLDSKFYKINDFDYKLLEYIKKNKQYFYFNGIIKKPKNFN